jgi:molecular chaperone DnaJ
MSSGIKDYYEILGVEKGCSQEEIRRAFRAKARECHPDVCPDGDGEERFKQVNEAYEVLSDPRKREVYDRFGTADPRVARAGGFGDVPFEDIFGMGMEDVFSMFFGGAAGGRRQVRLHGRDMSASVTVTLEEVATGVEKELEYTRDAPCEACSSRGTVDGSVVTCPDCQGTGRKRVVRQTFLGSMQTVTACERCGAVGQVVDKPCKDCGGNGRLRRRERTSVSVPAGARDGSSVAKPGLGEAGLRGAPAGDLVVGVRVAQHEFLLRDGADLHVRVRIPFVRAALGGGVSVQGLYQGEEEVKVPAGTQSGDTVRVKNRGLPRASGGGYGSLHVHFVVETPEKLDREQRRLLEEYERTLGDDEVRRDRVREWLQDR